MIIEFGYYKILDGLTQGVKLSEAENLQRLEDYITEKEALLIGLFEPSEGDSQQEHTVQGCIVINLSRSWFDKLTTND